MKFLRSLAFPALLFTVASLLALSSAETTITHSYGVVNTGGRLTIRLDIGETAPPEDTTIEVDLPVAAGGTAWSSGGLPISCTVGDTAAGFAAIAEGVLALTVPADVTPSSGGVLTVECETVRTTDKPVSLPAAIRFDADTFATPTVTVIAPYDVSKLTAAVVTERKNKTTGSGGGALKVAVGGGLGTDITGEGYYFEYTLTGKAQFVAGTFEGCNITIGDYTESVDADEDTTQKLSIEIASDTMLTKDQAFVINCGNATRPDYNSNVRCRIHFTGTHSLKFNV